MKIYLVEVDNGEQWEDYRSWIEKAYTTYRGASQYLLDYSYTPYMIDDNLWFYWEENDEYMSKSSDARIIEMELNN